MLAYVIPGTIIIGQFDTDIVHYHFRAKKYDLTTYMYKSIALSIGTI